MTAFVTSSCRSCGRAVIWATTTTGNKMPVDAEPVDGGNVILVDRYWLPAERRAYASVVSNGDGTHVSHFVTCPHAGQHRRRPSTSRDEAMRRAAS